MFFQGIDLFLQAVDFPVVVIDIIVDQSYLGVDIIDHRISLGQFSLYQGKLAKAGFFVFGNGTLGPLQFLDFLLDLFALFFQLFPALSLRGRHHQESTQHDKGDFPQSCPEEITFCHIQRIVRLTQRWAVN
jgi:hypothetical protein